MNTRLVADVALEIHALCNIRGLSKLEKYAALKMAYQAYLTTLRKLGYTPDDIIEEKF